MPGADLHDRVGERSTAERGQGIPAEELEGARRAELVPQRLEAQVLAGLPARQQEPDHLAERPDRAIGPEPAEEGAHHRREALGIDAVAALDARQRIGGVDGHVLAGGLGGGEVEPRVAQPLLEGVAVVLRRDDEAVAVGGEPGPDVVDQRVDQGRVLVVELDEVLGGDRGRIRPVHGVQPQGATHVPVGAPPRRARYRPRKTALTTTGKRRLPPAWREAVLSSRSLFPRARSWTVVSGPPIPSTSAGCGARGAGSRRPGRTAGRDRTRARPRSRRAADRREPANPASSPS